MPSSEETSRLIKVKATWYQQGLRVWPSITIFTTEPIPIYTQASISTNLALWTVEPQLLRAAERPLSGHPSGERGPPDNLCGRGGSGTCHGEGAEAARSCGQNCGGRREGRSRGAARGSRRGRPALPACPAPEGQRPFPANSVQRRGRGEAPSGEAHRPTKLFQNHPCVTRGRAPRRPMRRCGAIFGANGRVEEAGASWSSGSAGRSAEESGAEET